MLGLHCFAQIEMQTVLAQRGGVTDKQWPQKIKPGLYADAQRLDLDGQVPSQAPKRQRMRMTNSPRWIHCAFAYGTTVVGDWFPAPP